MSTLSSSERDLVINALPPFVLFLGNQAEEADRRGYALDHEHFTERVEAARDLLVRLTAERDQKVPDDDRLATEVEDEIQAQVAHAFEKEGEAWFDDHSGDRLAAVAAAAATQVLSARGWLRRGPKRGTP